jgi:hypothetical protein
MARTGVGGSTQQVLSHLTLLALVFVPLIVMGNKITFEKMTNRDYAGTTYYTIRNVSLYECLGAFRVQTV